MYEFCHRCHAELNGKGSAGGEVDRVSGSTDAPLFCPFCSAPQILLPEHMRTPGDSAPETTGTPPPPRLHRPEIDWRAALAAGALVAIVGAVLAVLMLKVEQLAFFSTLWVMGSGAIALTLYLRQRPLSWMNAQAGWRIGLATGLLLIAARGVALSATGVVARFALHDMAGFDRDRAQSSEVLVQFLTQQGASREFLDEYRAESLSPERVAGSMLFGLGAQSGLMMLVAAGGGAFAGSLRTRRRVAD